MNLEVYRDGELDSSYERQKQIQAAVGHFARIGHKVTTALGNAAREAVTPVILDITDHRNGSHLREQYFANKRAGEVATVAQLVGIELE